jgi:hypothetical protein
LGGDGEFASGRPIEGRPRCHPSPLSWTFLPHGHFAPKSSLHQLVTESHSFSIRAIVRERPSFIDPEGIAFGLGN